MKRLVSLLLLFASPLAAAPVTNEALRARHAMVASVSEIASRVGADVMKKGGNAIDATVAVAFALQVVWPEAGNIGGGGFLPFRPPNRENQSNSNAEGATPWRPRGRCVHFLGAPG